MRRDKEEVGARRCLWGSACQSFSRESLSRALSGPDLPSHWGQAHSRLEVRREGKRHS